MLAVKRKSQKKRKARPSEAQVKFEGKKADVAAFEEYCNNVRALLKADAYPDIGTYEGLCRQIKTTLPGDKLRKLALEQTCSRHLEFILQFVENHVATLSADDEEHDARVEASLDLVKHFIRELLGYCAHTAQSDYGSHLLEKLFSTIPTILKHSMDITMSDSASELRSAMSLNFQEMTAIYGEDGALESGIFWDLLDDPRATCVLRTIFAVSIGCRLEKNDNLKIEEVAGAICGDKVAELALSIFGNAEAMEWIYKNAYVSQRAAPTLQILLLAISKLHEPLLSAADQKMIKKQLVPHRLDGSVDVDYVGHLVKDTGPGNRMMEFIISRCLDEADLALFVDQYLQLNVKELAADSKGNFIVQATLKAASLKAKYLNKILPELDWASGISRNSGVIWAAVEAAARLNTSHGLVIEALQDALQSSGDNKGCFWPSLLLMQPKADLALLEGGRIHSLGVSIGQSLLNFPVKAIALLLDSLTELIQKSEFPLKQTACHKQASYLYQKLIQLTAGSVRFGPVVAAFTPISRSLAFNPTGSFVLGELLTHAKGEERQKILKELQSILTELRARNFSLYKKHGLGDAEKKITSSDSRFQKNDIATKKVSKQRQVLKKPRNSNRNMKKSS